MSSEALLAAYVATCYRVYLPGDCLDLRVGEANAPLAAWLAREGITCFAVLTAFNPGSIVLSAEENAQRQADLIGELLLGNYETYNAENLADNAAWPLEESVFVPHLERLDALALAADYGQNAVLWGSAEGIPMLAWTAELDT
ncbi:DUF3293 domain-containing protein [Azonexus sp.]|uniref:DUF3293 domain-containing protein n=1 Tax=Azonexus sp. TaxID=1872668 RepID=UPI0039E3F4F2